jgi:Ig kappa chain C region, A allele
VQAKEASLKRYPPLAKYGPVIGVDDTFYPTAVSIKTKREVFALCIHIDYQPHSMHILRLLLAGSVLEL